jgi:hypothetical protein
MVLFRTVRLFLYFCYLMALIFGGLKLLKQKLVPIDTKICKFLLFLSENKLRVEIFSRYINTVYILQRSIQQQCRNTGKQIKQFCCYLFYCSRTSKRSRRIVLLERELPLYIFVDDYRQNYSFCVCLEMKCTDLK